MKFNLIISALLAVGAMATFKNMSASQIRSSYYGWNGASRRSLCSSFLDLRREQLEAFRFDELEELFGFIEHYRGEQLPPSCAKLIPIEILKNPTQVCDLLKHIRGSLVGLIGNLDVEQFGELVKISSRYSLLSGRILAQLEREKLPEYMQHVTPAFLDQLFATDNGRESLPKAVIQSLPANFLSEVKYPPAADDGRYWTEAQLGGLEEWYRSDLPFRAVPMDSIKYIAKVRALRRLIVEKKLSDEQLRGVPTEHWNYLLLDSSVCRSLPQSIQFGDISGINFTAKCFSELPPPMQVYIMLYHKNPTQDILSLVTKSMVERWVHGKSTGLEVLKFAQRKAIIKKLMSHPASALSAYLPTKEEEDLPEFFPSCKPTIPKTISKNESAAEPAVTETKPAASPQAKANPLIQSLEKSTVKDLTSPTNKDAPSQPSSSLPTATVSTNSIAPRLTLSPSGIRPKPTVAEPAVARPIIEPIVTELMVHAQIIFNILMAVLVAHLYLRP